jgi:hypothetical protein
VYAEIDTFSNDSTDTGTGFNNIYGSAVIFPDPDITFQIIRGPAQDPTQKLDK